MAQGERIKEVLKQPQYKPLAVEYQVIIIYAVTRRYLLDVEVADILDFQDGLFEFVDTKYPELPKSIREQKEITDEIEELLKKVIVEYKEERKTAGRVV